MKKIISVVLQTILLLLVYAAGSFLPPFHIMRTLASAPNAARFFVWDGIMLMFAVYILILLIEAARKRLRTSATGSTIALVLATILGLAAKLGFITVTR